MRVSLLTKAYFMTFMYTAKPRQRVMQSRAVAWLVSRGKLAYESIFYDFYVYGEAVTASEEITSCSMAVKYIS